MPQIKITDFSAGWCPSDDPVNGRKNGLLKMDGARLGENGALVMPGGTKRIAFQYPSRAHTLFSKFVCDERRRYLALEDGSVYRNETEIVAASEGSLARAAFGLFGDFVLIASGATKVKDICGTGIANLGLEPPDEALEITPIVTYIDEDLAGTLTNFQEFGSYANGSVSVSGDEISLTTGTYSAASKTEAVRNTLDFPKDLAGAEEDVFQFEMKIDDISKLVASNQMAVRIRFTAASYAWSHEVILGGNDLIGVMTPNEYRTFRITRAEFGDTASDPFDWSNIETMDITVVSDGTLADAVFTFKNFKLIDSTGGALNGTYTWLQVNVYRSGSFTSKSLAGPVSESFTIEPGFAVITPFDPTIIEPSATEVWIYRRGGELSDYYRVGIIDMDEFGTFEDLLSDEEVLSINERLDTDSLSVSDGITDDILEIVGPVHHRALYFTETEVYFSDIYNPDTFNPNRTQNTTRSEAEKFLWARLVSENTVIYGTSHDLYIITGTWVTYPDGVIDIEIRPLGVDKPPISRDVAVYKGNVAYFSARGWQLCSLGNDYVTLINPSTFLLYNGEQRFEYGGVPVAYEPSYRYSLTVAKDTLYCVTPVITDYTSTATREDRNTWSRRLEIYDFIQKYWYPFNYAPWLLDTEEDGTILGFFDNDNRLGIVDYTFSKLLNYTGV